METNQSKSQQERVETEKRQIGILRSGNSSAIIDTIQEIRTHGSVTILPELFDLLLISENIEIVKACSALLNDLKNKESVRYLVSALENKRYKPIRHILVSACWQNGLDFHEDIQLFANIFLKDEYITSVEAFTVIENNIGKLEDQGIVQLIEKLNREINKADDKKKPLIIELLSTIRNY
ncbi:MAG: hypothetical protein WD577_09050 [Bacteroidales bacterium]